MSNEMIWVILTLAGVSAAVLIAILWGVTNILRTKSGKIIDSVKRSKKQLLLAVTPGHRGNLFKVNPFTPGNLETLQFKDRVRKQRKTFVEPKLTEVTLQVSDFQKDPAFKDLSDEQKKEMLEITQDCINHMLRSNTEKVFLEEGVPITLAVEDKVVTAGVKGVGSLLFYEKLCKIKNLKAKIDALKESKEYAEVAEYLSGLLSRITPINVDVIRNYFGSDYDQTDDEAQKEYHYMQGWRDRDQSKGGGTEKLFVYGGIAIGICGIVGGAVIAFLA